MAKDKNVVMDTRYSVKEFGDGKSWVYDGWMGILPDYLEPWYSAEASNSNGGTITGPHRKTHEDARKDALKYLEGIPERDIEPYETARVVSFAPALRITIEEEVQSEKKLAKREDAILESYIENLKRLNASDKLISAAEEAAEEIRQERKRKFEDD